MLPVCRRCTQRPLIRREETGSNHVQRITHLRWALHTPGVSYRGWHVQPTTRIITTGLGSASYMNTDDLFGVHLYHSLPEWAICLPTCSSFITPVLIILLPRVCFSMGGKKVLKQRTKTINIYIYVQYVFLFPGGRSSNYHSVLCIILINSHGRPLKTAHLPCMCQHLYATLIVLELVFLHYWCIDYWYF